MPASVDRIRSALVTTATLTAIVLASIVGLNAWADEAAVHASTAGTTSPLP